MQIMIVITILVLASHAMAETGITQALSYILPPPPTNIMLWYLKLVAKSLSNSSINNTQSL